MLNVRNKSLAISVGLILLYLIFPIIAVIGVSFNGSTALTFPPQNISLTWYREVLSSPDWIDSIGVTLRVGTLTAAISILLGVPTAFAISRYALPAKRLLNSVILSALIAPPVIRAISTYLFFVPLGLDNTMLGLAIAHSIAGIPLVVINVVASLRSFDTVLERAALIHGANPFRAIRTITLPVIAPGIVIGGVFAFMQSAQELIISIVVLSNVHMPMAVKLWEGVRVAVDPSIAAASALLVAMATIGFGCVAAVKMWGDRRKSAYQ